jgi:hypothetical protein
VRPTILSYVCKTYQVEVSGFNLTSKLLKSGVSGCSISQSKSFKFNGCETLQRAAVEQVLAKAFSVLTKDEFFEPPCTLFA